MQSREIQTMSTQHSAMVHAGMRDLTLDEICYVSGGDDGDGSSGSPSDGYSGTQVGSPGSNQCKPTDTAASCEARLDGYKACDALSALVNWVAEASRIKAAQDLAAQVGPACTNAVDNTVDLKYKTPIYENQQSSSSFGDAGTNYTAPTYESTQSTSTYDPANDYYYGFETSGCN